MHIHTKLMIRLLLAWPFLSALIGVVVFFIEAKKILEVKHPSDRSRMKSTGTCRAAKKIPISPWVMEAWSEKKPRSGSTNVPCQKGALKKSLAFRVIVGCNIHSHPTGMTVALSISVTGIGRSRKEDG
jgi:hypothetical protein